jgi:hypothetical protein
LWSETKAGFND